MRDMGRRAARGLWALAALGSAGLAVFLGLVSLDLVRAEWPAREQAGESFSAQGPYYVSAHTSMVRQVFLARKPPGVFRVFVLGGSQAMGVPFVQPANRFWSLNEGGIATWLKPYLEPLMPNRRVEVINACKAGWDLAASAGTFEEIARIGAPDLVVVMNADNERGGLRSARPGHPYQLDPPADLDGRLRALTRSYALALKRIISQADGAGIKTYVLTVADNIRDYAPDDAGDALRFYRLAQTYDALNRRDKALEYYIRAKDRDRDFMRCRSPFNELIRAMARGRFAKAIDMEKILFGYARDGIPGSDLFFDYCHFRLRTSQIAAHEIAKRFAAHSGLDARVLDRVSLPRLGSAKLRLVCLVTGLKWKRLEYASRWDKIGASNALAVWGNYRQGAGMP